MLALSQFMVVGQVEHKQLGRTQKHRRRFKKTQRRSQLDALKRKYKVVQNGYENFTVFLTPSDPQFAFPLAVLEFDLSVPFQYPQKSAVTMRITDGVPREFALNVEQAFGTFNGTLAERVAELDAQLERLLMMKPQRIVRIVKPTNAKSAARKSEPQDSPETTAGASGEESTSEEHDVSNDDTDSDSALASAGIDGSGESDSKEAASAPDAAAHPKREGTEVTFPDLQLWHIAICEITRLNFVLQCGRCKHPQEFRDLESGEYAQSGPAVSVPCDKCALPLGAAFRKEFLHAFCSTAGYLDLANGKALDLLPCRFVGVCERCGETSPQFSELDYGHAASMNCLHCHQKLTIKVGSFRLTVVSTNTLPAEKLVRSAGPERLRLQGGQPLPDNGRCKHYRRSMRWFRFSCCKRVFPCDRCHNEQASHPAEPAQRMICGTCSREQNMSDTCRFCGHNYSVTHSAFWEGGKGTRDKTRMSRKDPRKYKRRGRA